MQRPYRPVNLEAALQAHLSGGPPLKIVGWDGVYVPFQKEIASLAE